MSAPENGCVSASVPIGTVSVLPFVERFGIMYATPAPSARLFRQWSSPTTVACEGGLGSGPSEPDTVESLRVMAYEMVCGALKAVTKEDKTQLGLSGKLEERKTWHFVLSQLLGNKVGVDAARLVSIDVQDAYSAEEWESMDLLHTFYVTELT